MGIIFDELEIEQNPYPHFLSRKSFQEEVADEIYRWLKSTDEWIFVETDFYTQYEFSLREAALPAKLAFLVTEDTIENFTNVLEKSFKVPRLELVEVTAHKLLDGYRMGIHNDFIGTEESHRLIFQFNPSWTPNNGGFLMVFASRNADSLVKLIKPSNNAAFAFEISASSFHAVSQVHNFERMTIVYTFKRANEKCTST